MTSESISFKKKFMLSTTSIQIILFVEVTQDRFLHALGSLFESFIYSGTPEKFIFYTNCNKKIIS